MVRDEGLMREAQSVISLVPPPVPPMNQCDITVGNLNNHKIN